MLRPALFAILLASAGASAAGAAEPLYRAVLEHPATSNVIVKDVRWSCAGAACSAPRTATAPDVNVCSAVARKLGRLAGFEAAGRNFDKAELGRCNAAAR
jgi:hypothetical protein